MLNQNLSSILDKGISRYSLVTATAKRARQIAEKNLEENIITTEKPVSVALDEILENQYKILESEELERK
ncbi:MAG: DNA-directed RNA polymerase subunit omega [Clostridia bacterium]|nr:DNA-directed RNA polymerase subunit omega [Clostridia bacterium]